MLCYNKLLLNTDGANASAVVDVVVARGDTAGVEEQAESEAAVARTGPIGAAATCIVEARIAAITSIRQEDTVAIALAGYLFTFNAIYCCPCSGGVTAIV